MGQEFKNPYRPGAGHAPPFLAGRHNETKEFKKFLTQEIILENVILTGLRGVGKTVLLDTFKPLAQEQGWGWVGTDLSETASLTEENIAIRLLTDLAVVTSALVSGERPQMQIGFGSIPIVQSRSMDFEALLTIYRQTPGLVADKLKQILEVVWTLLSGLGHRGLIFAYDEAQNMADHSERHEYPLSLLLDVFQSIQRKGVPFMLVLTGLPTLFPKLVEARTFAERMFHVITIDSLSLAESREAIIRPLEKESCPVKLTEESVVTVCQVSAGYPYFIQFICREVFDIFLQNLSSPISPSVPVSSLLRKLDTDFFAGRWAKATDRQRDLLFVAAHLDQAGGEFAIKDLVEMSKVVLAKPIRSNHISQLLAQLINTGLVYKGRHGKYCFAVPLMHDFIKRQAPLDEDFRPR